jgi:hypothetical protein
MTDYLAPQTKEQLKEIIDDALANGIKDLNFIDVSKITNFSNLFYNRKDINDIDISEWDVSNGETFLSMFSECKGFNCDLSKWSLDSVKDARYMFFNCKKLTTAPKLP